MDLVRTKFDPPASSLEAMLERPRLVQRLEEEQHKRLVLVQTPAGYGKTSLLLQRFQSLRQSGRIAAWLHVDSADQDPATLLTYIGMALAHASLTFESSLDCFTAANLSATPTAVLAQVVKALEQCRDRVHLFLDDVHLLGQSTAGALYRLIESAPPNTHFVVASRSMPDLHLARARARGEILEFGIEDLRFTRDEANSFMIRYCGTALGETDLDRLEERTEGWIAGIKLVSLAIRGGVPSTQVLASFTGTRRSVAEFFVEEVFASQSAETREFLLRTSILERFSPELCTAVTELPNARRLLNHIEESGLFLQQLDEERTWFRYHHLFAEFLQRRLSDEYPGAAAQLHSRASESLWNSGLYAEAIDHALQAGDPERAAALLDSQCQDLTYAGKFRQVLKFTSQVPQSVLDRYPRILLTMAWLLTRNLRFEESRALLDVVRDRLNKLEAAHEISAEELRRLRYVLLHREMVLSAARDDAPTVEGQCQQLIDGFPEERHPYLSATIYGQLLYARREQYQLGDLERLKATAQGIVNRSAYSFASIGLHASIGPSLFFAGKSDAATQVLEQGLAEAIRYGGLNSALAALPALPLSEILYEANDLTRAAQLIENTMPFATELAFVDQLLPGYITRARICRAHGDGIGAERALDEAMTIAFERSLPRLRFAVIAERVRMLIQDGHPDEAARCIAEAEIGGSGEAVLPRGAVSTQSELRALAWTRVAQSSERSAEAVNVAKHWRSFCAARGAFRSLVRWEVLLAQILFVSGDLRGAQRALRDAIAHAAGSRLVRSFIDEGPVVRSLLAATYEGELEVLHPTDAFAAVLLEAFELSGMERSGSQANTNAPEGLYGKLSPKEREILALVSSGMRNREVAKKLGMTEGSVKWYMQQVYDKVGTRRRLQAVQRARQFGLIA